MKKQVNIFLCFLMVTAFNSCRQKELLPAAYVNWIENQDNGLKVLTTVDHLIFELFYKPSDFIALQELGDDWEDMAQFDQKVNELKGMQYYTLKVGSANGAILEPTNNEERKDLFQYYLSDAQKDFQLVQDGDTLPCLIYHFERNYGMTNYNSILLAFEQHQEMSGSKSIVMKGRPLGLQDVVMTIDQQSINHIPQLIR